MTPPNPISHFEQGFVVACFLLPSGNSGLTLLCCCSLQSKIGLRRAKCYNFTGQSFRLGATTPGSGLYSLKEVTTCFGFAQLRATLIPWVSIVQISFASSVKSGTKQPVVTKMMSCSNHACTLQRRHEKMPVDNIHGSGCQRLMPQKFIDSKSITVTKRRVGLSWLSKDISRLN